MMEIHSTRPACAYCHKEGLIGQLIKNDHYMDFGVHYVTMCGLCLRYNYLSESWKNITVIENQTKMEYGHTWD